MQTISINESSDSLRRILFVAELATNTNEVQRINLGDISTSDSFTLTYAGQTTTAINYNATPATIAADIDAALEGLSNIDAAAITVAHVSAQLYDITFGGNLANTDVALVTINPTGFTPGGAAVTTRHGGIQGAPVLGATFAASDITISKNGGAPANSTGTVTEIGNGRYYYTAAAGEVDTLGFLSLVVLRAEFAIVFPTVQIVQQSSALGAPVIRSGTAQGGTSTTITLDSGAGALSNIYVPSLAYIRTGTGAGQARLVHAYNGTTKVATIEPDWISTPSTDSVFDLLPVSPSFADQFRVNHTVIGTFAEVATPAEIAQQTQDLIISGSGPLNSDTLNTLDARIPAALVGGKMNADATAISGSVVAADKLEAHTVSVMQVLSTTGSTTTTFVLNATTGVDGGVPSAVDDTFNGRVLVITSGALAGQAKTIVDYTGATKTLTLESAFTGAAASGVTGVVV